MSDVIWYFLMLWQGVDGVLLHSLGALGTGTHVRQQMTAVVASPCALLMCQVDLQQTHVSKHTQLGDENV